MISRMRLRVASGPASSDPRNEGDDPCQERGWCQQQLCESRMKAKSTFLPASSAKPTLRAIRSSARAAETTTTAPGLWSSQAPYACLSPTAATASPRKAAHSRLTLVCLAEAIVSGPNSRWDTRRSRPTTPSETSWPLPTNPFRWPPCTPRTDPRRLRQYNRGGRFLRRNQLRN